jgi:hypothetical protein
VDLVERGYLGEVSNFKQGWTSDGHQMPLLCGCREFNYLACAVTLGIHGSVPGSVKRYAAQGHG